MNLLIIWRICVSSHFSSIYRRRLPLSPLISLVLQSYINYSISFQFILISLVSFATHLYFILKKGCWLIIGIKQTIEWERDLSRMNYYSLWGVIVGDWGRRCYWILDVSLSIHSMNFLILTRSWDISSTCNWSLSCWYSFRFKKGSGQTNHRPFGCQSIRRSNGKKRRRWRRSLSFIFYWRHRSETKERKIKREEETRRNYHI